MNIIIYNKSIVPKSSFKTIQKVIAFKVNCPTLTNNNQFSIGFYSEALIVKNT